MPSSMSESSDPIALTTNIVSAFVANNSLPLAELPALIQSVHASLVKIASGAVSPTAPEPAASAGGNGPKVDHAGLSHLSGRRPQIQIFAAAPDGAGNDAGAIPREVEPAG